MSTNPTKPVETAWILLQRVQQTLLEQVEGALKRAGLPPLAWYDVLLELSREPDSGLRPYEISEHILLNKHNLSRLIDRLEEKALVKRQTCDADGRGNLVLITKKGMQLKQAMWPVYAKVMQERVGGRLSSDQLTALIDILRTLAHTTPDG